MYTINPYNHELKQDLSAVKFNYCPLGPQYKCIGTRLAMNSSHLADGNLRDYYEILVCMPELEQCEHGREDYGVAPHHMLHCGRIF